MNKLPTLVLLAMSATFFAGWSVGYLWPKEQQEQVAHQPGPPPDALTELEQLTWRYAQRRALSPCSNPAMRGFCIGQEMGFWELRDKILLNQNKQPT